MASRGWETVEADISPMIIRGHALELAQGPKVWLDVLSTYPLGRQKRPIIRTNIHTEALSHHYGGFNITRIRVNKNWQPFSGVPKSPERQPHRPNHPSKMP
ncbi:hypothetical protein MGYG_01877 [Nannizzia gypsea CBS 118893]|uniref:Uncharacterized protein n=1 Tax=Arthroderma gypseum (strain ATCC MYA-4604 / CBS 118893) TaxID=535722 RepID=E5QYJ9_ARTGP|nr:hypothetical protein MGYG_01877 [Nannizzia gypsea CBS 118893]EFQ98862.1 hypothetical protein MGYG_01877 [Nannizzia gypsea CBS 118893]